jgi:preprotein translocase subunit SecE
MEQLRANIKEYTEELFYKVQWPTLEELQSSTITVFVSCIFIAILVALVDFVFKNVFDLLFSLV